ncbi:MAG: 2-keto-4-pentenoate hydratase [Rhizobiaceae bacterium]
MNAVNQSAVEAIARDIVQAAEFAAHSGASDLASAYAVQDAVADKLVADGSRKAVAGYKLAANSKGAMQHFALTEPAAGRVFGDQVHSSPAELAADTFRQFAYEPEITAIMGASLPASGAPYSKEDVAAAIARFVPGFEILELRGAEMPKIGIVEAVAQNITNAGIVIGGPGISPSELVPAEVHTVVTIDGKPELDVTGAAPQDPLEAVTWLANHLVSRGLSLEAGQCVLCGTHAPIRPVAGPARIEAKMSGLGDVTLTLR